MKGEILGDCNTPLQLYLIVLTDEHDRNLELESNQFLLFFILLADILNVYHTKYILFSRNGYIISQNFV